MRARCEFPADRGWKFFCFHRCFHGVVHHLKGRVIIEESAIVLDKSFICTASAAQVKEVCETHKTLMTEDLFFELIHDDKATRAWTFSKFPEKDNPVGILPPVGVLMRYEAENKQPATPVSDFTWDINYRFNAKLGTGEFDLSHQQLEGVREWETDLATATEHFAERAQAIVNIFPVLEGYRPGQDRTRIEEVLRDIACDMDGLRRFYAGVAPQGFVDASLVDTNWAVFRYMQVHLTADVEFLAKYGVNVNVPNMAKLENERADLNYLVCALLAKGLATNDEPMKKRFRRLCPEGLLVEPRKGKVS